MKKCDLIPGVPQSDMFSDIKGLVLAGGASQRMGQDKGDLKYYHQPQKYHVAEMLTGIGLDTYISIRKEQEHLPGFSYIFDHYKNIGPMAGIVSAFKHYKTAWLVLGCDYPFLKTKHLDYLLSKRDKSKVATVFSEEDNGFLLPTLAIYESHFLPLLQHSIHHEEYSLQKLLKKNKINIITTQDQAFKSIDNPVAYRAVKKEIHENTIRNS